MAWDSTRPVPWTRLAREWLIYVGIMGVVFVLFFRNDGLVGILAGLLVSGPLYLMVGYVLAKLGYRRETLSQRRAQPKQTADASVDTEERPRPKPAPTRRTGAAPAKRPPKRKR